MGCEAKERIETNLNIESLKAVPAPGERAPKEWFACKTDNDCVHIHFPCAGGVVNKIFEDYARTYYRNKTNISMCSKANKLDKKETPYRVFCKDMKCAYEGEPTD